jgi:hypothetical protein
MLDGEILVYLWSESNMLWRKINLELLLKSGLVYRFFITCAQTLFLWGTTGKFELALGASIVWNGINLLLYYLYHYMFYRMFKMGK